RMRRSTMPQGSEENLLIATSGLHLIVDRGAASPNQLCETLRLDKSMMLPDGSQEPGHSSCLGCLLERVRQLNQSRFAPGAAEERNPHRQARQESRRHVDIRITRY